MINSEITRRTFMLWRAGARLDSDDIARLAVTAQLPMSANRLRELGRDSRRALSITPDELEALMFAWRSEQRPDIAANVTLSVALPHAPMHRRMHLSARGAQECELAIADLYKKAAGQSARMDWITADIDSIRHRLDPAGVPTEITSVSGRRSVAVETVPAQRERGSTRRIEIQPGRLIVALDSNRSRRPSGGPDLPTPAPSRAVAVQDHTTTRTAGAGARPTKHSP